MLSLPGAQVQSLVGELRFHKIVIRPKKKNQFREILGFPGDSVVKNSPAMLETQEM